VRVYHRRGERFLLKKGKEETSQRLGVKAGWGKKRRRFRELSLPKEKSPKERGHSFGGKGERLYN